MSSSVHNLTPAQATKIAPCTASAAPKGKTFPEHVWEALACFRSVQLAIVLLSLMCLATLAGVLLPQDGLVQTAQIKQQFGENYRLFRAMGLFNVYSSSWYIAIQVLFFFNLLIGSFRWLKPAYLAATRVTYCDPVHIEAARHHWSVTTQKNPAETINALRPLLTKRYYKVHVSEKTTETGESLWRLYATKGNWSRFGPATAHLGILLLLIASLWGVFTGFKAQKLAVPGETFTLSNVDAFIPNMDLKYWQGKVPDWKVTVKDFRIDYYVNRPGTPKQYYADLLIQETGSGRELGKKTIAVNHPIQIEDVTIYQATFNPTGKLFLEVDGKPRAVEVNSEFQNRPISMTSLLPQDKPAPNSTAGKAARTATLANLASGPDEQSLIVFPFFVQQDKGVTQNYIRVFIHGKEGFAGAKPGQMPENLKLLAGESGKLNGHTIRFIKPEIATGLQIKKAPEVPLMYLAFLIVSLGTFMCYFSQRQIWVAVQPTSAITGEYELLFQFRTNKARLSFEKELTQLLPQITEQIGGKVAANQSGNTGNTSPQPLVEHNRRPLDVPASAQPATLNA